MAASPSSPSTTPSLQKPYEVYVSFMPKDTLKVFVEDLFAAFDEKGINSFKEDEKFERGKSITSEISKAIETSSIAIIVFSENYGSSSWCMDELAKIWERKKGFGQIVYWVEVSVQTTPGSYIVDTNTSKFKLWRNRLEEAGLSMDTCFEGFESKRVKEIVDAVLLKLRYINKSHDVFLSFTDEDTCRNFVDHLYYALDQKGIRSLRDNKRNTKGESIPNELLKHIGESRVVVIVFSKNYATSSWYLDELVHILDYKKELGQIVFPVFYDVIPADVRKQRGCFGKGLAIHGEKEKLKWREALTEVASFSGWDLSSPENWSEAECVKKIVQTIWLQLHPRIQVGIPS